MIFIKLILNNIGVKVSILSIIINFFLFIFKLIAGIVGGSNAMVSDAIHSLSDVSTTILVIIGLIISGKDADKSHPYGHERIESVFGIILSFILLLTGIGIGYLGIKYILEGFTGNLYHPGLFALIAAIISIIVKEMMYRYTIKVAKNIKSTSMEADAWHHRSDALSSIGAFIGILASRLGFVILDPICSIIICILIIKSAIEIFMRAVSEMIDTACDDETNKYIIDTIYNINNNIVINELKTRMFGSKIYMDVEIAIDGEKTLNEASKIASTIHDKVEDKIDIIKHCNINIVPK